MATSSSETIERKSAKMQAEETMQHLVELFGNVLDLEIIQSVAHSCDFNMETTSHILIEMSSSIGAVPKKPLQGKQQNNDKQLFSHANTNYPRLKNGDNSDDDVIVVSHNDNQTFSYATIMNNSRLKNCDDNDDDVVIVSEKNVNFPSAKTNIYTLQNQKKAASPQRKSKKEQEFERIILHVKQGSRILILMRGLPGSGKSYLAKQIINKSICYSNHSDFILSADDFFIDHRTGRYVYDRMRISSAHDWNHQRAYTAMNQGISPVIIDNTNLQAWEMKPYVMMAVKFGYSVEVVEPFTHWAFNDRELARRNLHDVPKVKIKEMIERYEKNITPHKLFAMYCLAYGPNCKPPIYRTYPPINHLQGSNGMDNLSFVNNQSSSQNLTGYIKTDKAKSSVALDLMDFDSDVAVQSTGSTINKAKNNPECDLIDSILMHDTFSSSSPDILKPNVWNLPQKHTAIAHLNMQPDIKKARTLSIDSETKDVQDTLNADEEISENSKRAGHINKLRNFYPKLDLSSWGLSDTAISSWESWDIVKPVNPLSEQERMRYVQNQSIAASCIPYTSDSATNTSYTDFSVLRSDDHAPEDVKLLEAKSRNINEGVVRPVINSSKKTLLDKSSMTNEDVLSAALSRERDATDDKQIAVLVSLFPGTPIDHLKDVYEKCGRDINWTGDILLDDKREVLPFLQTGNNDNNNNRSNNNSSEINSMNKEENENSSDSLQLNMGELSLAPEKSAENCNDKKNKSLSESSKEIKKHIEENVEINKDYYSKHILKLKDQRYGTNNKVTDPHPSTSKLSTFEAFSTSSGEVIAVNTDVDLDNFEPDIDFPETEEEEEEMMELNLGDGVISQLETQFGFSQILPQGYLPIIHVHVSLARQLYALYVESVLVQMENQNQVFDAIAKEDKEFARKLQMQEHQMNQTEEGRKTPDLQEIMDEQTAAKLYLEEIEEWKKLTPDNLAARLTRQKLYSAFPTVKKDLLMEILHAHNNSYEQTVEVLMASTDQNKINDPDGNIMQPPITETDVNEMKIAEEESRKTAYTPDVPKTAREYREEAGQHHQKHIELMQKAQQAYQRKQYEVAQFYSDLAKTHTQFYDQANSLAASAFLEEHSKKLENFHTIDLHYLYVKEAISALDMFLDRNIRLLAGSDKKTENLFVITGRGKRSDQGKSRLKPAVMARLRKRDIWYMEVNPGLLKVRVRPHSALTSSLH